MAISATDVEKVQTLDDFLALANAAVKNAN